MDLDEVFSIERLITMILDALPVEKYSTTKRQAVRNPELSLEEIQSVMKTIFIDHSERL